MRIVVTGATGNIGTSVLKSLAGEPGVERVIGIGRRLPSESIAKAEFAARDVAKDELLDVFAGADAVVHLAWLLQPRREEARLESVNVGGSARVFDAVVRAGVPQLVVASSVGAYSPGPKDRRVEESWPTCGIASSLYSRQKAKVERALDRLEGAHPELRVARLRPALVFKREASSEIRRLFLGRLLPLSVLRIPALRLVPNMPRFRFQAVHSLDVGEAFRSAVVRRAHGAYNIAAEPVLDARQIADALGAKSVRVPRLVFRGAAAAGYHLRLQPTDPGWVDLALQVPLMSTERAARELGWSARRTSTEALAELVHGIARSAGAPTAPLEPEGSR